MAESGQAKSLLIGLAISLVTLLICFAMVEGFLAYRHSTRQAMLAKKYDKRELCNQRSEHRELIYTRVPGLASCQSNIHGYRGRDFSYEKPAGVRRVVIIGDSVAIGQGIRLSQTFSSKLERRLNSELGYPGHFEVIVLGESGYSTSQELFLLEHIAPRYDPDLVIWVYVLNDPAHPVYHGANGELGRFFYEPRFHTAHFIGRQLLEIREKLARAECPNEYHAFLHCAYRDEVRQMISRIGELSDASGVPLLFAICPVFKKAGDFTSYPLVEVDMQLREYAEAAGLDVMDMLAAFTPYSPDQVAQVTNRGTLDPWHPNEKGAAIISDALFESIIDGNYFDAAKVEQITR